MTRWLLACALVWAVSGPVWAAEQFDLAAPVTPPSITSWRVDELHLQWTARVIEVVLVGPNGERKTHLYTGQTAANLMVALNKANLSTSSLQKRVLERLATDGVISGTVSGTPD